MASTPNQTITAIISDPINGLPTTYRTERPCAVETELPAKGSALGTRFGTKYQNNIVIDANKIPKGGQTMEVIIHCDPLPGGLMKGSTKIREINAAMLYTEQVVSVASVGTSDPNVTYQPINPELSLKRTEVPPTDALDAYHDQFPSSANFDIPPILVSLTAVWHEDSGNGESQTEWKGLAVGESRSLSGNESNSVQASAGLIPEVVPVIRRIAADRMPTTAHFFYLPMPVTTADILGKCGAGAVWPIFKPEEISITLKGSKVSVQASASASAAFSTGDDAVTGSVDLTKGTGVSYDCSPFINVVNFPATLHGSLTVANATHSPVAITASASAGWIGDKGTTLEDAVSTPAWADVAGMPSVTSERTELAEASGSISPTTFSATSPATVPTSGIYLFDSRVEPWDFGYARVFAETVDASIFA